MALIDELLKQIQEKALRSALVKEVDTLRQRKSFGLVFEKHLPEIAVVTGAPIRPGMIVRRRDRPDSDTEYLVESVTARAAVIRSDAGRGKSESHPLKALATVKRFGDPVFPGLRSCGQVSRNGGRPYHTVINGENFHALQLLAVFGENSVDCIYIDPPYNTGARDWTYNNHFVDSSDSYRHSKWLSFIEKRLRIARRLLKSDGVLVITIDEHEVHHLGMLLEQLFPDAYRQMVSIAINPKGVTQERFSRVEEYAIFCFLGNSKLASIGDDLLTPLSDEEEDESGAPARPRWKGLIRSGTNARRVDRKRMFYPVLIDVERGAVVDVGEPLLPVEKQPNLDKKIKGLTPAWPIRSDGSLGNWGVGAATLKTLIEKGYVSVGRYDPKRRTWGLAYLARTAQEQIESGVLEVVSYDEDRNVVDVRYTAPTARRIKTMWHRTSHDAGAYGTGVLRAFLGDGQRFPFPKSLYAVRDTLGALVGDRPDALIVDFFAGSGTTLHATCLLNQSDGGHRRCILVTNNEVDPELGAKLNADGYFRGDPKFEKHGIFEAVTKPRCVAAITGKRPDGEVVDGRYLAGQLYAEGFDENVEFFDLEYLDPDEVELDRAFETIYPLIWLVAGSRAVREPHREDQPFLIDPAGQFAVLFDDSKMHSFHGQVATMPELSHVFHTTNDPEAFAELVALVGGERFTRMLYRDYVAACRTSARAAL